MSLETFLHNLHYDIDKTKPPNLVVDWEDGPLAYKLYRRLPAVPLCPEAPLTLEGCEAKMQPNLRQIGHFLWHAFGLTQLSQSILASNFMVPTTNLLQMYRRFAPSGGALYPNELYVYLKIEDLPAGVYHYDVAHHRLVLLREGHFDSYLARALGDRYDTPACFGTVFVTTMFWKNFFKYNNFSYRLQGLDAGTLIGQLLEVAKRFGFTSGVFFQYLDRAVNHLLGITEQEESVYAVIPLSVEPALSWFAHRNWREEGVTPITATNLCRELPRLQHDHYVKSRRVKDFPMLTQMNEASLLESFLPVARIREQPALHSEDPVVYLPNVDRLSYDLAPVSRKRYSPNSDFMLGKVSQEQLALLLVEATASYRYLNDLDEAHETFDPRVSLYVCLYNVEGIPEGAYQYDSKAHVLRALRHGDHRLKLQLGMPSDNVNLLQVPLCFHIVGDKEHLTTEMGYRGYRIQQMEAGMLVQRLLLAASAIGFGGHPLLGFDVGLSDEIYKITTKELTSLIQVPVGPYRHGPRLTGGLHG
ncbi:SagB family peptide dehydrogenase [Paenibacillus faecalis]|uniref:SagB family peptide dehydrogenase n=1 Tax=Paenibacillus faecalis TaxID=2079532 RepID=UPI000D0FC219|nr:SagB family peptide dehydrogenase [Paenibacillus faecalis]